MVRAVFGCQGTAQNCSGQGNVRDQLFAHCQDTLRVAPPHYERRLDVVGFLAQLQRHAGKPAQYKEENVILLVHRLYCSVLGLFVNMNQLSQASILATYPTGMQFWKPSNFAHCAAEPPLVAPKTQLVP